MSRNIAHDPFSTKGALIIPELSNDTSSTWQGFRFEANLKSDHFSLAPVAKPRLDELKSEVLNLSLEDVHLADLDEQSSTASHVNDDHEKISLEKATSDDGFETIWSFQELKAASTAAGIISWDDFYAPKQTEQHQPNYLTECGSIVYDNLLHANHLDPQGRSVQYANLDAFRFALRNLAIGQESAFFTWNQRLQCFEPIFSHYIVSGISRDSLKDLTRTFISHGNTYRRMRASAANQALTDPIHAAFLSSITTCLDVVHEKFTSESSQSISLVRQHVMLLRSMESMKVLQAVYDCSVSLRRKQLLFSDVVCSLETVMQQFPFCKLVLAEIFRRIVDPLLGELLELLSSTPSFHKDAATSQSMQLLPTRISSTLNETRNHLSILSDGSFLTAMDNSLMLLSQRRLLITWHDIIELESHIEHEEQQIVERLHVSNYRSSKKHVWQKEDNSIVDTTKDQGLAFAIDLALPTPSILGIMVQDLSKDGLKHEFNMTLENQEISCEAELSLSQALEFSVFPLILAQHRLTSYQVLRRLFMDEKLLKTFEVLRGYLLLGNGVFSTRLSDALFSPDERSGEHSRVSGGKIGLRLQNRDSWPPATSELRIALLNILSDSLSQSGDKLLQDNLSFAIRDLPDEELERVRDIDSIHATDFLRLAYKPANQLIETVFDVDTLDKYDQIFRFMLLVLRVKAASQSLLSEVILRGQVGTEISSNHRTRYELHHFMMSFFDYCEGIAIAIPWRRLLNLLHQISQSLASQDYYGTLRVASSVQYFRLQHERCLDNMLESLFLKPEQIIIREALESVFSHALKFSASCNKDQSKTKSARGHWHRDLKAKLSTFLEHVSKDANRNVNVGSPKFYDFAVRIDVN